MAKEEEDLINSLFDHFEQIGMPPTKEANACLPYILEAMYFGINSVISEQEPIKTEDNKKVLKPNQELEISKNGDTYLVTHYPNGFKKIEYVKPDQYITQEEYNKGVEQ